MAMVLQKIFKLIVLYNESHDWINEKLLPETMVAQFVDVM